MKLENINIGYCFTGSFCTFRKSINVLKQLIDLKANVYPIMSYNSYNLDTKFGKAKDFIDEIETLTGKKIIHSIQDAEPIGPKRMFDILIVAPCSGNTISKIANDIVDTPVIMAVNAHIF